MSDFYTPPAEGPGGPPAQGEQITPFLLGAGNSLLFGLPEAGLKALGGEKVKKIVDEYKAKNKGAYEAGDVAGTVGSMLIPGGAIARGASGVAKFFGAGKMAEGLGKVAKVASGPMGIKQGIATAAEQAVPRAASDLLEGKDLLDVAGEATAGLALGGGVGLVGSGIRKIGGYLPKRLGEETEEMANDQFLSQVFGKTLGRGIRQVVGNKAGASTQIEKIDNLKNQMVDTLVKHDIKNSQQVEDLLGENGKAWQEIGDGVNKAIKTGKMESLAALPNDMLSHPDIVEVANLYGKAGDDAIQDIAAQIGRTATDPANTFAKTREILNKNINLGFKGGTSETIRGDAATAMKNYFDQKAMDVVPDTANISALKEVYPAFLAMGKAIARDKAGVAPAFTPGSDTYARFVSTMSDIGGAPAAVVGNIAGQALNKAATAGANILGSEAALGIRKAIPRNAQGVPLELSDIPQNIQDAGRLAGKSLVAGAERAPGSVAQGVMVPATPVEFAQPMPNPDFDPETPEKAAKPPTADPLNDALEDVWRLEDPTGNISATNPGIKQDFIAGLRKRLVDKDGNIDYMRAAKVLTRGNSDDEKNLQESLTSLRQIQGAFPNAVKLLNIGNKKAETDKQLVVDTVSGVLKKGGMEEKQGRALVENILGNPMKTPQEKAALVYDLLSKYNPTAFGQGGILHRVGVLK